MLMIVFHHRCRSPRTSPPPGTSALLITFPESVEHVRALLGVLGTGLALPRLPAGSFKLLAVRVVVL
jgi:hypothetical protein